MATFSNSRIAYWDRVEDEDMLGSVDFYDKDNVGGRLGVKLPLESVQADAWDPAIFATILGGDYLDGAEIGAGISVTPTIFRTIKTETNSRTGDHYIENVLRGVIYYDPSEIIGFFTEDTYVDMRIWNAKYSDIILSNMAVTNPEGTSFDPWTYPVGMGQDTHDEYIITIYVDGPPSLDTLYTLTIDGETFTTYISGVRILPFLLPINWDNGFRLSLEHDTIIQKNDVLREQRRPLLNRMMKKINVKINLETVEKQDIFIHWAEKTQERILAMPMYQEAMFVTSDIAIGQTVITVLEDIEYFKFLNTANYILIVDHEANAGEIKNISSINTGTKTITLSNGMISGFNWESTAIYTVTFVTTGTIDYDLKNDTVSSVSIQFAEYRKEI